MNPAAQREMQQKYDRKRISTDTTITSNKKGFEYLNELFIKRHRKILWNSAKRIAIISALIFAGLLVFIIAIPEERAEVNELVMTFLLLLIILSGMELLKI